jgi:hypothetical protein
LAINQPDGDRAVALWAAGCGSSGAPNAAFTSKASAICAAGGAAVNNLTPGDLAQFKTAETIVATTLFKLQALSVPSDRVAAFHSFISALKQMQAALIGEASAVSRRDQAKALSIDGTVPGIMARGDAAAKAAGIRCG